MELHYKKRGLRFSCRKCGNCCRITGAAYVYVTQAEVERMAHCLKLEISTFARKYLRKSDEELPALRDKSNSECVFWEGKCSVYPARPNQCRTFPFWRDNVTTKSAWESLAKEYGCQGIDRGKWYSPARIGKLTGNQDHPEA